MPDRIKEPPFLDLTESPAGFVTPTTQPIGPDWWDGRWPVGGINSLAGLERWVEKQLDEMICLQETDTLAYLSRPLGIQALKNADRYLGRNGTVNHPRRPCDEQLQSVEDVEDALEAVLRYLRQQLADGVITASEPAVPSPTSRPGKPPLKSWIQSNLDSAIRKYVAERAAAFESLRKAVRDDQKGAVEEARRTFGRNSIAIALRVKARAMVSKSPEWQAIADDLGLRDRHRKPVPGRFDIVVDDKAAFLGDPVSQSVELQDAIRHVRKNLGDRPEADAIVAKLEDRKILPERAEELVDLVLAQRAEDRIGRKSR
jgi:hypothetical protein